MMLTTARRGVVMREPLFLSCSSHSSSMFVNSEFDIRHPNDNDNPFHYKASPFFVKPVMCGVQEILYTLWGLGMGTL
jgi:hypothetical protein